MKPYIVPTIRVRTLNMELLLTASERSLPYDQDSPTKDALSRAFWFWEE